MIAVLLKLNVKLDGINLFFARGWYCPTSTSTGWHFMINGKIYPPQSTLSSVQLLSELVQRSETYQSLCKTGQSGDPPPPRKGVGRSYAAGEWEGVTTAPPSSVAPFPELGKPCVRVHQRLPKDVVETRLWGWIDYASGSLPTALAFCSCDDPHPVHTKKMAVTHQSPSSVRHHLSGVSFVTSCAVSSCALPSPG